MRIAIFIKRTTLHEGYGGLETQNKVLSEGLARRGYQVTVFSPKKSLEINSTTEYGVRYVFIDCEEKYSLFADVNPNSWINRSYKVFQEMNKDKRFELIISQSSAGLGVIRHKSEFFAPVISISHGTTLGEFQTTLKSINSLKSLLMIIPNSIYVLRQFFGRQREFIHGSNRVIAVSRRVKQALIEETFVDESKVVVINNGVDENTFTGYVKRENKVVNLIYTSRVVRSKGIFLLAECMNHLPNAVLNVIGEGEDMKAFRAYVEKNGLGDRVKILGKIPYNDIIPKIFENDIFVLPSLRLEGFPMTIVEAMFAGLPVVASDIGGISDAVFEGKTGYLVRPGDKDGLIVRLLELCGNPELRNRLGLEARKMAFQNFTLSRMLDKYEEVFRSSMK